MRLLRFTATAMVLILSLASCKKDDVPQEDWTPVTIQVKSEGATNTVSFTDSYIVKETKDDGEYTGLSLLTAKSGGKMVYDMFTFFLYFDKISKMKEGSTINPKSCLFSFIASSDADNHTTAYGGKIVLAKKAGDYAVLHFDNVTFSVAFGDYVFDGDLKCPYRQ